MLFLLFALGMNQQQVHKHHYQSKPDNGKHSAPGAAILAAH
jgi:hypothetical protein